MSRLELGEHTFPVNLTSGKKNCLAALILGSTMLSCINQSSLAGGQGPARYVLGPGDRLQVKLFQVEGFDSAVAVLPDGTVILPRLPALQVSGLTLDQARYAIEKA